MLHVVHRRVNPSIKFASTHLCTWVKRGTVRVKYLAQEHNTMSPTRAQNWAGLLNAELSALTMRPLTLHNGIYTQYTVDIYCVYVLYLYAIQIVHTLVLITFDTFVN